jgi:hypothetical protein
MQRTQPRRRSPSHDKPVPADPVVTQLCADLVLARKVQDRINAGWIVATDEEIANMRLLERNATRHLAGYLSAKAWVTEAKGK